MSFGEKLQSLRKENKLSQEKLADMLNVSRQAVSKWESNQAYPEMDKLIILASIFKCSVDDLVNPNIKKIENTEKEEKKNFNPIDELLDLINRSYVMFSKMKFKDFVALALNMLFVIIVLMLFSNFVFIINDMANNVFMNFGPSIGNILSSIFKFLITMIYIIFSIIIVVYIYKIRYLENDKNIVDNKKTIKEESDTQEESSIKEESDKVIFKKVESKTRNYSLINILSKIVIVFVKVMTFFCGLPFLFTLFFISMGLVISLILIFKGVFYIGFILLMIFALILNVIIVELIIDFILDHGFNKKRIVILFITSIIGIGLASGIFALEISSTKYIDTLEEKASIYTYEYEMTDKLGIDLYNYEFIETDNNNIKIEVEYYEDYNKVQIEKSRDILYVKQYNNEAGLKLTQEIIKDLSKKEIRNYNLLYDFKIRIYTSQETFEKLKNNNDIYIEEDRYDDYLDEIVSYENTIQELNEQLDLKNAEISSLNEKITEYETKIDSINSQIEDLKSYLNN